MKRAVVFAIGLVMTLFTAPLFAQKQFSAEVVDASKQGGFSHSKIYMGERKIRIEPEGKQSDSAMNPTAIIMDADAQKNYVVIDEQRIVVENVPSSMRTTKMLPDVWWHLDVNDPCGSMRKWREENNMREDRSEWSNCKNLGSERVNGRSATKWQATNGQGETGYFWLDPELHFPLKVESKDSHMTLENIKEGTQPASLFEPPAGYRVVTMQQMVQEMMKRQRP